MDDLYISHFSALEIYRKLRASYKLRLIQQSNSHPGKYNNCTYKKILMFANFWEEINYWPKDFIVSDKNFMHRSNYYCTHYSGMKYPYNSFVQIHDHVFVASPELMFFQLAPKLSREKLALIIMELCGSYALFSDQDKKLISNLSSLTSLEKINAFIKNTNKHVSGINKLSDALKMSANGSASPQESILYIILCSPHKFGGYNIQDISLNQKVKLSTKASEIACQKYIYPDLSVKRVKIAIEYDSDEYHDNSLQNRKDKLRQDALQLDGWKIYSFVTGQLRNKKSLDNMAKMILDSIGQTSRIRMKDFYVRQKSLMRKLEC